MGVRLVVTSATGMFDSTGDRGEFPSVAAAKTQGKRLGWGSVFEVREKSGKVTRYAVTRPKSGGTRLSEIK